MTLRGSLPTGPKRRIKRQIKRQTKPRPQPQAWVRGARTRTEFLATLANELRTPLSAVTGFAQRLQLGPPGGAPGLAVAGSGGHIQLAGEMMVTLVDDLGDLASTDAGAPRWQGLRVPVHALICESCAWLQQRDSSVARRICIDALPLDLAL